MAIPPIGAAGISGLGPAFQVGSATSPQPAAGSGFGAVLMNALSSLNASQNTAASDEMALATGQTTDVAGVVSDVERASLEMDLATQVRDRSVAAWQQLSQMQM